MCCCVGSYADLVIPRGASNTVAMHLLITEVKNQLKRRGFDIRKQLVLRTCAPEIPETATILPQTKQVKSYHTIICDAATSREDFVFHSERLMRLVLEFLVSRLPHTEVQVPLGSADCYDTKRCVVPAMSTCSDISGQWAAIASLAALLRACHRCGSRSPPWAQPPSVCSPRQPPSVCSPRPPPSYVSHPPLIHTHTPTLGTLLSRPAKRIVGVSVLRSGLAMEPALSEVVQGVSLGRILITTNSETREPELHYCSLPDVKDCTVVLMDPTMATGAAAMMAVRVLLDHGAAEEDINIATLITTLRGMHSVHHAFPKVKICATTGDHELDERFHLVPGVGNFGDRFFGTTMEPDQLAAIPGGRDK